MTVRIVIIDYGMGNLRNVQKAFEHIGIPARISSRGQDLLAADGLVLPGVGAFGDAMHNLRQASLVAPIQQSVAAGKPLIGICLGLQLLFQESTEMGEYEGLGLLAGRVIRFGTELKVPHIGWNQLDFAERAPKSPLLRGLHNHSYAYFVHSYHAVPADAGCVLTTTEYGIDFASMVEHNNVFGAQFHPEKSQEVGLAMLRNYADFVKGSAT
jgi:glutamine amidotransferase